MLVLVQESTLEEYEEIVLPIFRGLFSAPKTVQATVTILENLHIILQKTSREDIRAEILTFLFNSFESTTIQVQVPRPPVHVQFDPQKSNCISLIEPRRYKPTPTPECCLSGCGKCLRAHGRLDDPQEDSTENQGGLREEPERHQNHHQRLAVSGTDVRQAGQVPGDNLLREFNSP